MDELSKAARQLLTDEGEWTDEAGLELVKAGLAIPTQIELTTAGKDLREQLVQQDDQPT